jgi:hypothetical protein
MDPLNLKPAIDQVDTQTIPTLENAENAVVNNAVGQLNNIVAGALLALQATVSKATVDIQSMITGLDGWAATITIPPITIRLSAPLKEKKEGTR